MAIPDTKYNYAPIAFPVTGGGDDPHGERLIATTTDMPSSEAHPYLEVVAPATLPEGYTFEAEANGNNFTVKVPVGGVEGGQKFSVPFPAGANGYSGAAIPRASVPVGHWKDGMCDCFTHGVIHPVIWNACCCPLVLAGQVTHRLKLTWLGDEGTVAQTTATFRILLLITVVYNVIYQILSTLPIVLLDLWSKQDEQMGQAQSNILTDVYIGKMFFMLSFSTFTIILVAKTRNRIRSKYSIPEQQCGGCEDCCCSFWCTCLTVAQMARHTADYETYAGLCCSETGIPPHAPSIV